MPCMFIEQEQKEDSKSRLLLMIKKFISKLLIVILLCSSSIHTASALSPEVEVIKQFLEGLLDQNSSNSYYDNSFLYPESTVYCVPRGSLSNIFNEEIAFTSEGNTFFYDKDTTNKRMAIIQNGSAMSSDKNKQYDASIFIRADGVTKENLVDLIIKRKIVVTRQAKVVFAINVTENNKTTNKFYLYASNGAIREPGDCILNTRFTHIGNIRSRDRRKYIVADGDIRIIFPRPPTLLTGDSSNITGEGELVCKFRKLPLDDNYLPGVEEAFDGTLVNDIKTEAGL